MEVNIKEVDLYDPIEALLLEKGYEVHGEVKSCDILAKKDTGIIAIELKKQINLKLLMQAVEKKDITESVYVAVIKPKNYKKGRAYNKLIRLVKTLELGLIYVNFLEYKTEVFIEFHPMEYEKKQRGDKKRAILKEIDNRAFNINKGGVSKAKTMTAYREENILIGCILEKEDELSVKEIRCKGGSEKAGKILYSNCYGWFERRRRGIYAITPKGVKEIQDYNQIYDYYKKKIDSK